MPTKPEAGTSGLADSGAGCGFLRAAAIISSVTQAGRALRSGAAQIPGATPRGPATCRRLAAVIRAPCAGTYVDDPLATLGTTAATVSDETAAARTTKPRLMAGRCPCPDCDKHRNPARSVRWVRSVRPRASAGRG